MVLNSNEILIGYEVDTNLPVTTTIEDIIKNRTLAEGDSGSGKSHLMTVQIEGSDQKAQRLIIDIEGEYFTLKNNFQFLLMGKTNETVKVDIDLNLTDIYVEKLAKKLLEKSIDTIIDLSEYPNEATHFISILFKAILKYSKLMKRPLLIFLDEAHIFAPEKGIGNEESLRAVIEMAKRGRKRGIGIICGTQAIADFSKNVVRQLRTRFIGNCNYDKDIKTACHYLGFSRDREHELTTLGEDHNFFVAGAGLKVGDKKPNKVIKIKAIETLTELYDFKFDKKIKIIDKDPNAIRNLKDEFKDIPQEITEELTEKEKLQIKVNELYKQLSEKTEQLRKSVNEQSKKGMVDNKELERLENNFIYLLNKRDQIIKDLKNLLDTIQTYLEAYGEGASQKAQKFLEENRKISIPEKYTRPIKPVKQETLTQGPIAQASKNIELETPIDVSTKFEDTVQPTNDNELKISPRERAYLIALAQAGKVITRRRMVLTSGHSIKSSGIKDTISKFHINKLINKVGQDLEITQKGLEILGDYDRIPEDLESKIRYWKLHLRKGPSAFLQVLYDQQGIPIQINELANKAGYSPLSSGIKDIKSELNTRGLINTVPDGIILSDEMTT